MAYDRMQRIVWVLWPSFIVGGMGCGVFFSLFDPAELPGYGEWIDSRTAVYSIGFFMFWAFAGASSLFTCFLQRSPFELNRCTLRPSDRPPGCPKRGEEAACCDDSLSNASRDSLAQHAR